MNERLLSDEEQWTIRLSGDSQQENISQAIKAQDSKTIAARDKWWVEQIERYEAMLNRNLDSHSIIIPWASWQSLKQSLEAGK